MSTTFFRKSTRVLACALLGLALGATGCSVNRSLHLADGETTDSGLTTVNGSIRVGADCEVRGTCRTVNGSVRVDEGSRVADLATVNGSVELAEKVTVNGDVETVNGSIECGSGTTVDGNVANVNGRIRLHGTTVQGHVRTHNGSIGLLDGTRVAKDVVIEHSGHTSGDRTLEIEISGGSVVEGDVDARDSGRDVQVILESGSEVQGEILGAEIIHRDAAAGPADPS